MIKTFKKDICNIWGQRYENSRLASRRMLRWSRHYWVHNLLLVMNGEGSGVALDRCCNSAAEKGEGRGSRTGNQIQEQNGCRHKHTQQGTSRHKHKNKSAHGPSRARPFHTDKNWSCTIMLLSFHIWYQAQAELSLERHFLELLHLHLTATTNILRCGFILCLDIHC